MKTNRRRYLRLLITMIVVACTCACLGAEKKVITVSVLGRVNHPGDVQITDGKNFADAIAKAGGFMSTADRSKVQIWRIVKKAKVKFVKDAQAILDGRTKFELLDADRLIVPEKP